VRSHSDWTRPLRASLLALGLGLIVLVSLRHFILGVAFRQDVLTFEQKAMVLDTLQRWGDVKGLLKALDDPYLYRDSYTTHPLVSAAQSQRLGAAVEQGLVAALRSEDPVRRAGAVGILIGVRRLGNQELSSFASDPSPQVRYAAMRGTGLRHGEDGPDIQRHEIVFRHLEDSDEQVRREAISRLWGHAPCPLSRKVLEKAEAENSSAWVRNLAREALRKEPW